MKLQLNFNKPGNYAFFCPVSKVHLTRSNPVAFVNEVTPYISRGLKSKSIIEVSDDSDNNVTGQKTDKPEAKPIQTEKVKTTEAMPSIEEEPVAAPVEKVKEETVQVESEPTQQEAPAEHSEPKKRGRQKKA